MNMNRARQISWFLLRVVSGFLFVQAGGMKLFDWFGGSRRPSVAIRSSCLSLAWLECWNSTAVQPFCSGSLQRPVAFSALLEKCGRVLHGASATGDVAIQNHGEPRRSSMLHLLSLRHGGASGASTQNS